MTSSVGWRHGGMDGGARSSNSAWDSEGAATIPLGPLFRHYHHLVLPALTHSLCTACPRQLKDWLYHGILLWSSQIGPPNVIVSAGIGWIT